MQIVVRFYEWDIPVHESSRERLDQYSQELVMTFTIKGAISGLF